MQPLKAYVGAVFIALNQFANAITGGDPGETISLRSAKSWKNGESMGCILCKLLDFFVSEHCRIVGWRNGVEDMPKTENLHFSDLLPTNREEAVEFVVAFFGGASLATFIWWLTA